MSSYLSALLRGIAAMDAQDNSSVLSVVNLEFTSA